MSTVTFACAYCQAKVAVTATPFQSAAPSPYPWQEEMITYQYPKNGMMVTLRVPFCSPICLDLWRSTSANRDDVVRHLSGLQVLP